MTPVTHFFCRTAISIFLLHFSVIPIFYLPNFFSFAFALILLKEAYIRIESCRFLTYAGLTFTKNQNVSLAHREIERVPWTFLMFAFYSRFISIILQLKEVQKLTQKLLLGTKKRRFWGKTRKLFWSPRIDDSPRFFSKIVRKSENSSEIIRI